MIMKPTHCKYCGTAIPLARLSALPGIDTCVEHSEATPVKGFMTWEHKTAPVFNLVDDDQHETLQRWSRKGVHAQLPIDSPKNPTLARGSHNPINVGSSNARRPTFGEIDKCTDTPSRRCRKCGVEPRATPVGLCVRCALEWYADRNKWK